MPDMPRTSAFDSSVAFMRDPYRFISKTLPRTENRRIPDAPHGLPALPRSQFVMSEVRSEEERALPRTTV